MMILLKNLCCKKHPKYKSFLIILKLIAPIMPFITEEIYQEYFKKIEKDKSIHISGWPEIKVLMLRMFLM